MNARAKRFGMPMQEIPTLDATAAPTTEGDAPEKKPKHLNMANEMASRMGLPVRSAEEEEKMKQRAARFATK